MKIATIIVRTLMGLLFLFASITYFFELITPPPNEGAMKIFGDGLEASVYIMPTVKVIELICGLAFVSGRFVPLASILIAPIIVNIFFVHTFLDPKGLPVAAFLVVANIFIAYVNRDSYKPLFRASI
jgi:putative oxidoreductase